MDDDRRSYYTVSNICTTRGTAGYKTRIEIIIDTHPSLVLSCKQPALK